MSDDHPESQSQSHRGDVPAGLQRRDFLLASGSVLAAAASSPTAATMAQAQAQPAPAPASGQKAQRRLHPGQHRLGRFERLWRDCPDATHR
jgi:hypothetical protein